MTLFFIHEPLPLTAAGPRPCYRAALASDKMCFASFCLSSPTLDIESKITVAIGFFTENIREPFAEIKTGKDYPETFQEQMLHYKTVIH